MKLEKKWLPVLSLGLGLPSMVFSLGVLTNYLVTEKVVSAALGYTLFFLLITYILGMISYYAIKRKN
jgi:hypothetical protein